MEPGGQTISLREHIAEEVRALLGRRRANGAKLAAALGKSEMYVSRRLSGKTAFDVDDLEKISAFLGVEVAELLPRPMPGRVLTTAGKGLPNDHSGDLAERSAKQRAARKSNPIGRPRRETTAPASAVAPTQRRPALNPGPGQRIAA